jgi:hypothetical protein
VGGYDFDWHQHLGAFQTAWHFTTHGQPIGKTGRKIVKENQLKLMG